MTRILLTRTWPAAVERLFVSRHGAVLNPRDVPLSPAEFCTAAREFDVICPTVTDRIPAEAFAQDGLRVRLLCNYGAGFEHIPLAACQQAGVAVTNTPDVLTDATAELAILLMLMVARRAGEGEREVRSGAWTGWRPTHMLGTSLVGKALGLVGFGRIAQRTAELAQGFGMRILYHSRRQAAPTVVERLGATFCASLDELLAQSDIVSLHCPGGAETERLINAARLDRMRADAFLINTARGSVIDDSALAAALQSGRIAGAGLDVFRGEPAIAPALLAAPNLVMLPHLGSATEETRTAMGLRALANLEQWLAGAEPADRVA